MYCLFYQIYRSSKANYDKTKSLWTLMLSAKKKTSTKSFPVAYSQLKQVKHRSIPRHQTWLIAIIAAAELASSSSRSFCTSTDLILVILVEAVEVETWVVVVVVVVVVQTWADRLNYSNGRDRLRRFHGCPWRADAQKHFVTEAFLCTSFSFTFVEGMALKQCELCINKSLDKSGFSEWLVCENF